MMLLDRQITKVKQALKRAKHAKRERQKVMDWEASGCPEPPPQSIKARELTLAQQTFGLNVFVETGTYKGDTLDAMASQFKRLYSIELSPHYYERAKHRFRYDTHVELLHGDSGEMIGPLVKSLDEPALFWLDGHYSGGKTALGEQTTPIYKEMDYILASPYKHVVFIDDARCFGEEDGYPTLEDFLGYLDKSDRKIVHEVKYDSIRLYIDCEPNP